jgi:hypothetical protein
VLWFRLGLIEQNAPLVWQIKGFQIEFSHRMNEQ